MHDVPYAFAHYQMSVSELELLLMDRHEASFAVLEARAAHEKSFEQMLLWADQHAGPIEQDLAREAREAHAALERHLADLREHLTRLIPSPGDPLLPDALDGLLREVAAGIAAFKTAWWHRESARNAFHAAIIPLVWPDPPGPAAPG